MIFILGMHRSGTSAVARLLNILGVELGQNLLDPSPEINAAGFWENRSVVDLNERLLLSLDSNWFDFGSYPVDWWLDEKMTHFYPKAAEIIKTELGQKDLVAIKDPRLCRLLPFWKKSMGDSFGHLFSVLVVRHPLEVVQSLVKRDGFASGTALMLWLLYVLEAELFSREMTRSIVTYDQVLDDWQSTAQRISSDLGIEWPFSVEHVHQKVETEINPKFRSCHISRNDTMDADPMIRLALSVYEQLTKRTLQSLDNALGTARKEFMTGQPMIQFLKDTLHQTNTLLVDRTRELMNMGESHGKALQVIEERDRQIKEFDMRLNDLGRAHHHAIKVVEERDETIAGQNRIIAGQEEELNRIKSHWSWRFVLRLLEAKL